MTLRRYVHMYKYICVCIRNSIHISITTEQFNIKTKQKTENDKDNSLSTTESLRYIHDTHE